MVGFSALLAAYHMVQPDLGLANLPVLDQFQVDLLSLHWSQPTSGICRVPKHGLVVICVAAAKELSNI